MPPIVFTFPVRSLSFILFCWLAVLADPVVVYAKDGSTEQTVQRLNLRTGQHAGFDRLVFDGPRGMTYILHRKGSTISVRFDRQATINLEPASRLTRAKTFFSRLEDKDGQKRLVVSFDIAPRTTIKDFMSGSSVVIDITGGTFQAAPPKNAESSALPVSVSQPVKKEKEEVSPTNKAPPLKKAEEIKKIEPAPEKTSGNKLAATDSTQVESSQPEPAKDDTATKAQSENSQEKVSAPAQEQQAFKLDVGTAPVLVLSLDPKVNTGTAIFSRGGYVTILFDRKLSLDIPTLLDGMKPLVNMEPVDLPKNTEYRFAIPEKVDVRVSREGTAWKIYLVRKIVDPAVSTTLVAQPDFALGARMLLPTSDAPDPVHFTDPVVGDTLIVVPLREVSAFSIRRRMADFMVIPAAQGMVIKPLHEKVSVRSFAEGVEITAEGGLKLSPAEDTGDTERIFKKGPAKFSKSLFDFSLWKGKPEEGFTKTRQKLEQTIVDVPELQRNLARLELARFYFAYGMGEETLAILSIIAKESPDILNHPEFLALRGAARILVGRAQEGLKDLSDPALVTQYEMALWQAMGEAELRNWADAEEKFSYTEDLWNKYAEPFRSRFAVMAVESALSLNKDREGAEWLDRLETQSHIPEVEPAMKYLRGVLQSKAGHMEEAENLWKEVKHSNDRLYKIRAELALIDLAVATHSLTSFQATERLEGLRYAWRGDDLELDILHRLGDYYLDAKKIKEALAVLQEAVHLFPNSSLTPPIRKEMAKTFNDIFMTDLGAGMSPVEALTMYDSYRDLIPQGEQGNAVKRNLAERLVDVDLLDQAAGLLEEQIKSGTLKNDDKMAIGARLAAIRLLDNKPELALTALEESQADLPSGAVSQDIENKRRLLRSRALSQQGKYDAALELLQNDNSVAAKSLHADITMRAQRWIEAAKVLQDLIGTPPKAGEQLTDEQAQWLVNCAIALSLAGDTSGLDKLAIDFGAAMAGTSQKDMFGVLTRLDKATPMKDIAAAQAKIKEVDMFQGFLNAYRKEALGSGKDQKKEN